MDRRLRDSRKQEKRIAADMGGRRTPGSGNQWFAKNDVRAPGWSVECKTTQAASYRLTLATLRAAEKNALIEQRDMALIVQIQGHSYAVLPYATFLSLLPGEDDP